MTRIIDLDIEIVASDLAFPEGPVAMADGSLLYVEIKGKKVQRLSPDGSISEVGNAGGGPNGLAIGVDNAVYVCNNGGLIFGSDHSMDLRGPAVEYTSGSIQRIDLSAGETTTLYTECNGIRLSAPNDMVIDEHGGIYFTDLGKYLATGHEYGGIFYALPDGSSIVPIAYPFTSPNGIGLSPDQQTLYVSDTESATLWAFDIEEPGVVTKRPFPSHGGARFVARLDQNVWFDSLAVQANGCICVATLIVGLFTVFSPEGGVVYQVRMPDGYPTNLCFSGEDMRTVWVTLSESGRIGRCTWPESGLKLNFNG